ncbi:uncharacterized protein GGS22DRAFT_170933 [Annulohypoxylon maeteangense]|uniref:uncharacterized protein n=1 Tax=Annulohypoxylon maeteangense TaxID=1927788 RepID=UPI002008D7AD|nr:uncharacterized protein GGS22DRAFT_170933 [Annulohypoxylon maeteangense]KAI0881866.1 hypothetical protein GGS22DRAFT_170933 [Annulohypoxylon maeteangense]
MLDENLPTFFFRHSANNPLLNILYFTQNGSEPAAEYSLQKINPDLPQSKNKYAIALGDAGIQDVIFGEVTIEPEFQQPTLSAAEIRQQNGVPPPPVPMIPDGFTIQLYNPEQKVAVKGEKSTWTGKESWEFEMPQQSFRMPSVSKVDRAQTNPVASVLTPKIMFKWKRDSKFSKDMTCYMTGTSVGGRKSKDPDITIALYKHGREPTVTVYEPNLQRVDIEDRKGLEVVLLLGAEVIREIYLFPNRDSFNIVGAPSRRKNSRPTPTPAPASTSPTNIHMMSGAMGNVPPATSTSPITQQPTPPNEARLEAEAKRMQAMKQQEEREREKRDRAEQKRIKRMLEDEERERQRRDAEVAKETERLRKQFGMEGQDFGPKPTLPPRSNVAGPSVSLQPPPIPPPRPLSAGPRPHANSGGGGFGNWFHGLGTSPGMPMMQGGLGYGYGNQPQTGQGRRRGGSADSGKVQKKKSTFF